MWERPVLAKADAERHKLLDAYYAGAIDVTLLKAEQARISADTRDAEERLGAVDGQLSEWQKIFEIAMRFATNCAKAYARASGRTRRRFNQAVFERIEVRDGKITNYRYHQPFDVLFSTSVFEYGDRVMVKGLEPRPLYCGRLRAAPRWTPLCEESAGQRQRPGGPKCIESRSRAVFESC